MSGVMTAEKTFLMPCSSEVMKPKLVIDERKSERKNLKRFKIFLKWESEGDDEDEDGPLFLKRVKRH